MRSNGPTTPSVHEPTRISARPATPHAADVAAGDFGRSGGDIDAETARVDEFVEQRAEQRPGPDAEIEDTELIPSPVGEERDCGLDDRLRFRARVEHVWRNRERKTPELAPADDLRQRLPGDAPHREFLEPRGRSAKGRLGRGNEGGRRKIGGRAKRQPGLADRLVQFGAPKLLDEKLERFGASGSRAEARFAQAT